MTVIELQVAVTVEVELFQGYWTWWAFRKDGRECGTTVVTRSSQQFDTREQAEADARKALTP